MDSISSPINQPLNQKSLFCLPQAIQPLLQVNEIEAPNDFKDTVNSVEKIFIEEVYKRITKEEKQSPGKTLQEITACFREVIAETFLQVQLLLGPAPEKWACIGIGDIGRGEIFPYSTVRLAFLVKKNNPDVQVYFHRFAKLLATRLGQIIAPLCEVLIGTPKELAESLKGEDTCLITGKKELQTEFEKKKRKISKEIGKRDNEKLNDPIFSFEEHFLPFFLQAKSKFNETSKDLEKGYTEL